MYIVTMPELVALLILLPALGAAIGYVFANDRTRKATGGKSPAELREEFEEYRAGVNTHFQETATLLDGMTEQYRTVYVHMAKGAFDLCDSADAGPRLEQLQAVLQVSDSTVDDVHSADADIEALHEQAADVAHDEHELAPQAKSDAHESTAATSETETEICDHADPLDSSAAPAPSIKTVAGSESKATEPDGGATGSAEEQENRPAA